MSDRLLTIAFNVELSGNKQTVSFMGFIPFFRHI